jgi:WXG100 protein secretion system (Wss), protein YukD
VGDPVLVTVVAPGGLRADLALPGNVPVAELLDLLQAALPGLPPTRASLAPLGGEPLPPASSLTACGIGDGAVLIVAADAADERAPARPPSPAPPGWQGALSTGGLPLGSRCPPATGAPASLLSPPDPPAALPEPWPLPVRLSVAVRALLGATRPGSAEEGGAAGPGWAPGRALRAWRDTSYERRLRAALAAAPSVRCELVAVVGAVPRSGATTVAGLLAAVLAQERPGRTVAVDASPGPGSLTELLAPSHDLFAAELVGLLDHPMLTRRELATVLARRGRLGVLAARPPAASPDERAWARLLRALGRHATTVVADCGPGVTPGARAALAAADQVVLVSDPRLPAAATTPSLLADRGRAALLLVNRVPGGLPDGAVAVRAPGGAVLLPADPVAAASFVAPPGAPGAPLGLERLPPLWRRRADELAMLLAAEWASLAPGPGPPGSTQSTAPTGRAARRSKARTPQVNAQAEAAIRLAGRRPRVLSWAAGDGCHLFI